MFQIGSEHSHQVIRFFKTDKVNDAIYNEESIKNVKDYCGDRNMSAQKFGYWSKKYCCWSKDYGKLTTNIIEKKKDQKIINNLPCYSCSMNCFSN